MSMRRTLILFVLLQLFLREQSYFHNPWPQETLQLPASLSSCRDWAGRGKGLPGTSCQCCCLELTTNQDSLIFLMNSASESTLNIPASRPSLTWTSSGSQSQVSTHHCYDYYKMCKHQVWAVWCWSVEEFSFLEHHLLAGIKVIIVTIQVWV